MSCPVETWTVCAECGRPVLRVLATALADGRPYCIDCVNEVWGVLVSEMNRRIEDNAVEHRRGYGGPDNH